MRRVALAAALLVPVLVPITSTSRAAAACAVGLEQRNSWHHVTSAGEIAMDDADPCRLLAVGPGRAIRRSDDGGVTWRPSGTAPTEAAQLVTSGLGSAEALLIGTGGGLWSTSDSGSTWHQATGLSGKVGRVVADPGTPSRVYAVAAADGPALPVTLPVGAGSSLYVSGDSGRTFSAVTGAANLAVSSVVPDADVPSRLWAGVAGTAGGLFVSPDGGTTFTRAAGGDVRDLTSSRLAGGGSEVIAATADGVLVSRDGGATVSPRLAGAVFTDVETEWEHPSAVMLLGASARRSSNTATSARNQSEGLPASCGAHSLRRDRSIPSVFLLSCADGGTFRYRADGTDLSSTDSPDGTTAVVPQALVLTPKAMRVLKRVRIAHRGSGEDGSIAFDGSVLYYADGQGRGIVHRQRARTGTAMPDLVTTVPDGIWQLAYDANRHHLILTSSKMRLWDVDLRNGRAVKMFRSPIVGNQSYQGSKEDEEVTVFPGGMTYDASTDRLLFSDDGDRGWVEYDREGHQTAACQSEQLTQGQVIVSGGPAGSTQFAGLVSTGDGQVYAETEDDSTVLRLDRSCHVLAAFNHEFFSEAHAENDALACDTTSFATPAIWMRDAGAGLLIAYEVPGGYCALPSTVSVSSPASVLSGGQGVVCGTLRLRSTGAPVSGQPMDLLVAGRGIGSPVTDAKGTACTTYVPLPREAGVGRTSTSSRQPVVAAFLGTAAYRPASARASLVVSRTVVPPQPPPPPPPIGEPHPVPVVVAPLPPPPIQPPPPPPNVPQQQPITQPQGHPGAQPGAMGALGAAPMPEDEAEVAAQAGDVHRMTSLADVPWEAGVLPLLAGLAMGTAAARRRRASRVRPQF
jgi:hypothetical protein